MLMVAAAGAALIALGILCQLIQIFVSIRDRDRDLTGDHGVAVRWKCQPRLRRRSITLPPLCRTFTNVTPSRKEMKEKGEAYQQLWTV